MSWIFPDRLHRLVNGALHHHKRRSDLTAPARIDIIMRRQTVESKGGNITDALFTATDSISIIMQISVKNGHYLLVIGIHDDPLAGFISFATVFQGYHRKRWFVGRRA